LILDGKPTASWNGLRSEPNRMNVNCSTEQTCS